VHSDCPADALFLALGKREAELKSLIEAGPDAQLSRRSLKNYSLKYVQTLRALSLATLVSSYIAWALVRSDGLTGHIPYFALSIVPFLIVIGRYVRSLNLGEGEDPQEVIRQDRVLLIAGAVTALLVGLGAY
jgi:decaprenyl-phosphate phosphoribosyltransferase